MFASLTLGFLIGLQHALEADHVAAVASLATGERTLRRMARHGAVWGLGHATTLLLIGGAIVVLGAAIPAGLANGLELAVGATLVALGGSVLYRLVRDRVHFHAHRHGSGAAHLHAHSHKGEGRDHQPDRHRHDHPRRLPVRTLLVGMTHGMAGSAALLLVGAGMVGSAPWQLLYIAVFGAGSILGMVVLSAAIAVPLAASARFLTWGRRVLETGIGSATAALGAVLIYRSAATAWPTLF